MLKALVALTAISLSVFASSDASAQYVPYTVYQGGYVAPAVPVVQPTVTYSASYPSPYVATPVPVTTVVTPQVVVSRPVVVARPVVTVPVVRPVPLYRPILRPFRPIFYNRYRY